MGIGKILKNNGIRVVEAKRFGTPGIYERFDGISRNGEREQFTATIDGSEIAFHPKGETTPPDFRFTPYDRLHPETAQPLHDDALLSELAARMADAPARWGKYRFDAMGIPAAYTYLGQLIAHDLTWDKAHANGCPSRFRPATLDFGSVSHGNGPAPQTTSGCPGEFTLGRTNAGRPDDLPRGADGDPRLADTRNDQNLTLSQLVVLVTKFYQVCAAQSTDQPDAALTARRHLQWIVLHDYLPRVIDPVVYRDVMTSGEWPLLGEGAGLVPIEFAAASFRLGHAMVRYRYPHWRQGGSGASLRDLLRFTHHSASSRLVETGDGKRLPDDWTVDWALLLPGDHAPGLSASIDENLAHTLFALPDTIGDCLASAPPPQGTGTGTINLAEHTLLRGNHLHLPSGQSLSAFAHARLRTAGAAPLPRRLPTPRLAQTRSPELAAFLASESAAALRSDTPLWFYFLREADIHASGQHFGPLASRVTMETIYRAIWNDPEGILRRDFKPDIASLHGRFDLKALHDHVRTHWKPVT